MSKKNNLKDELLNLINSAPDLRERDDAYSDDGELIYSNIYQIIIYLYFKN